MAEHQNLSSTAETKAKECLTFSFCSSLNLQSIKDKIASLLDHIGDNGMFSEYTMHDITHVDGMLALLDKIIPDGTKYIMTPADWLMAVLAVYFHDLGMLITTEEYENRKDNSEYQSTKNEMLKNADVKTYIDSLEGDKGEKFLYQEYVRRNHGKRIYEWINNCNKQQSEPYKLIADMIGGLDENFRSDLALICQSHQQDILPNRLNSVDEAYGSSDEEKVNLLYVSVLLRSADILHMTHDRTPDIEYRIISPRNEISVIEWAKQKAVRSVDIHYEKNEEGDTDKKSPVHSFEVQARFTDDKGYFSFKTFINDWVIPELKQCHKWCEESMKKNSTEYKFPWTDIDTSRVLAEGFEKSKLRFEIDQQNILNLLTGHTLYNDSTVVLRELIQNAMDAGKLQESKGKSSSTYQCRVEVSWNSKTRVLRVADNATGMDLNTITNYLLKVGASKYHSESFKKEYPDFHSISRFGIGLLTCFMISNDVDVYTLDEVEKKCHLLKIRNLHGEYLMRNDADKKNILDGKHGTTFELTVRPEIDMSNIESQIRQWIVIPFGEVKLSLDGEAPMRIGYKNVKEAVEGFAASLNEKGSSSDNFRVKQYSHGGVDVALFQKRNTLTKTWSLYRYRESEFCAEAPIGICVEGIKVLSDTPGLSGRNFLVLANCSGKNAPTTNVARNDLEGGKLLDEMYRSIYKMYIDSITEQLEDLQNAYSLTWASSEVSHLIDSFYHYGSYGIIKRRDILNKVLRQTKCNALDNGKTIEIVSIDDISDHVCTMDSRAFSSAVSLLKDMKSVNKTACGLLAELESKDMESETILLHADIAKCNYDLFLEDFEVSSIMVDGDARRIKFTWQRNSNNWKHINVFGRRSAFHLLVLMTADNVKIGGLGNKQSIISGNCIFLVEDSPLLLFMRKIIHDSQIGDEVIYTVADLVWQMFTEQISTKEHNVDRLLQQEDNYLKNSLFNHYTRDDLKEALKGCNETALDMRMYYHNK